MLLALAGAAVPTAAGGAASLPRRFVTLGASAAQPAAVSLHVVLQPGRQAVSFAGVSLTKPPLVAITGQLPKVIAKIGVWASCPKSGTQGVATWDRARLVVGLDANFSTSTEACSTSGDAAVRDIAFTDPAIPLVTDRGVARVGMPYASLPAGLRVGRRFEFGSTGSYGYDLQPNEEDCHPTVAPWTSATMPAQQYLVSFSVNRAGRIAQIGVNLPSAVEPLCRLSYQPFTHCPSSKALLAAWHHSPHPTYALSPSAVVTGFLGQQCWGQWVVATIVGSGNGQLVFRTMPRLHPASYGEVRLFTSDICTSATSPVGWRSPVWGIAGCGASDPVP